MEEVCRTPGRQETQGHKSLNSPDWFHYHILKSLSQKRDSIPGLWYLLVYTLPFSSSSYLWKIPPEQHYTLWYKSNPAVMDPLPPCLSGIVERDYTPPWGKTLPVGMSVLLRCTDGLWQTWEQIWKHSAIGRTSRDFFFLLPEHPKYLSRSESVAFLWWQLPEHLLLSTKTIKQ